jgi:hypothetical protein
MTSIEPTAVVEVRGDDGLVVDLIEAATAVRVALRSALARGD